MSSAAEGGGNPSKTLCRYYMNGACRMGSQCQFSHDRSDRPSNVCRYYLRGACSYGTHCRYDHVKPAKRSHENTEASISRTTTTTSSSTTAGSEMAVCNSVSSSFHPLQGEASNWRGNNQNGFHNIPEDSDDELGLVSLNQVAKKTEIAMNSKLRADAKEFVPTSFKTDSSSSLSYAHAVSANSSYPFNDSVQMSPGSKDLLCPYFMMGECQQGDLCPFTHGNICDLCNRAMLHPENQDQCIQHRQECLAEQEREMEFAFAVAKGEGKQCGICMEVVMEKANLSTRRFGVLPGCKHCFCLECIRKWRRAEQFENKVVRACPECRVQSDFVIPSTVWVEEEDEKRALLDAYQSSMKEKTCKYYQSGRVECPFGNKCFYRHIEPDGTVVPGDSPRTIRRRQLQRQRAREGAGPSAGLFLLWDFLEEQAWFRTNRDSRAELEDDDLMYEILIDGIFIDRLQIGNDSSDSSSYG